MSDFNPRYEPWFFKSDPGELCPFGCRCQEAAAKIESDAKVIAEKDAEIRSMIAVHNSDVDGMRLQGEKIADQKKEIAALRKALEVIKLTTFSGSEIGENYWRGNRDAHETCRRLATVALATTDEQTAGESK